MGYFKNTGGAMAMNSRVREMNKRRDGMQDGMRIFFDWNGAALLRRSTTRLSEVVNDAVVSSATGIRRDGHAGCWRMAREKFPP